MKIKSKVKAGNAMEDAAKAGLTVTFVSYNLETGEYFWSAS
jgi:hypothetical protein